jgi:hypothetical protein
VITYFTLILFAASLIVLLAVVFAWRRRHVPGGLALIADLSEAPARVKKLNGLLPLRPSSKKIRDDRGYGHQGENHVQDHAEMEFSHGLCPDCMDRLYPENAP